MSRTVFEDRPIWSFARLFDDHAFVEDFLPLYTVDARILSNKRQPCGDGMNVFYATDFSIKPTGNILASSSAGTA